MGIFEDQPTYRAVYRNHQVVLDESVEWPEGTRLVVAPVLPQCNLAECVAGHVIIVGFGLAGRYVAEICEAAGLSVTVVEKNSVTVETQDALGRKIILGDGTDAESLMDAGLSDAAILALTMPDEDAVLSAVATARRLRPDLYILARTNYSSRGMRASQLGADDVVKAEQAVALQFYRKLNLYLRKQAGAT